MKMIRRNLCAISGNADLETLYTFKKFPVYMGCTTDSQEKDILEDMEWGISKSSGLIQLLNLVPEDVVYQASHGSGSMGKTWQNHHKAFANFIYEFHPKDVLEIGGGHGLLAKNYPEAISWTILEPNPTPVEGTPAKYIKGFFDSNFKNKGEYHCFVHSHTFEHMYEPMKFMHTVSDFLQDGDMQFFSLPNFYSWFKDKFSNSICFEHTILLTEPYIDYILEQNHFRVMKKHNFENHSVFYAVIKDSENNRNNQKDFVVVNKNGGGYEENKNLFLSYVDYYKNSVCELNKQIKECVSKHKTVYVFGAHIFTQLLLNMGLDSRNISGILDNDPKKQNKRLYGSNMMVQSPEVLKEKNAAVILKCGAYNDEIRQGILEINENVQFL